jgi:protein-tyrosine phosphatase
MGNICRSPLAHGYFEDLVHKNNLGSLIAVDSAGTHAYHIGEMPDPRSQEVASRHGIDLTTQRGRKVSDKDFEVFDYILAMDEANLLMLKQRAPKEFHSKIHLFLDFSADSSVTEVPDPYYGGANGFDYVYSLVESASDGLLKHIQRTSL